MSAPLDRIAALAAEHSTEALLVSDAERVRFANQAFADLIGVPVTEVVGRGVDQIATVLDEPMTVERLRSALRQEQPFRGEAACHTKDGGSVPVDLSVIPIVGGPEPLFVVSAKDLRRVKRLEHQLWASQRLDAVTQLADGIAHEMNEAIQIISGYARLGAGPDRSLGPEEVAAIERASLRATSLLGHVFEFARRTPPVRAPIDLNAVVSDWEELFQALIGPRIRFIVDLAPDLPPIQGDKGELRHVLVNLVTNARDAMPGGGTLTIGTHGVLPDDRIRYQDLDDRLGAYVVLTVADSGTGMSSETKAQLFQPFFSTKGAPGTRGLGLATVQEIVRESGGLLWVRSQLGVGTSVEVHFPALPEQVAPAEEPAPIETTGWGNETILLVDDDPGVLKVAQRGLEQFGYRVLATRGAAEATALAAERGAEIALLLTDVMMPGQQGPGLAQELLSDWPHMKVLFISGYPGDGPAAESMLRAPHLTKPFTPEELARAVRMVFDS